MRRLITAIVRRRNSAFIWPDTLPESAVAAFAWQQAVKIIRGMSLWLRGRNPHMMLKGKGSRLHGLRQLHWGRFLKLGEHVYMNATSITGITLGHNVSIGAYSRLVASGSIANPGIGIRIGNNVGIGEFAYLGGGGGLQIGDDCIVGQYLSCHPENHETDNPTLPYRLQGVTRKGIIIGKNCWIGSKVTILDGVTIGNNCVIAAGAVVTKSFGDGCIIGGVPARVLRSVHAAITHPENVRL